MLRLRRKDAAIESETWDCGILPNGLAPLLVLSGIDQLAGQPLIGRAKEILGTNWFRGFFVLARDLLMWGARDDRRQNQQKDNDEMK